MMSQCRQNYHEECEAGINKQINLELYASYVYLSMVGFVMKHSLISRDGYPGFLLGGDAPLG